MNQSSIVTLLVPLTESDNTVQLLLLGSTISDTVQLLLLGGTSECSCVNSKL